MNVTAIALEVTNANVGERRGHDVFSVPRTIHPGIHHLGSRGLTGSDILSSSTVWHTCRSDALAESVVRNATDIALFLTPRTRGLYQRRIASKW
jgi:hypothetical protein